MDLREHGQTKYGDKDVLASSSGRHWRGIAAEHRRHPAGEIPSFRPQHMEIGIATGCHPESIVSRTGDGLRQHTRVEPGIIWFCPVGVLEEDIHISHWHDVLHIYVSPERFAQVTQAGGGRLARPEAVRYLGGIYDERIRLIGRELIAEMHLPSSAGSMRIDALSLSLTGCLVDNHSSDAPATGMRGSELRLDELRLRRVLDFMATHLEAEIGLDDLAREACFSAFHFSRVFANTMGVPPHRYLSQLRLERAKTLLALRTASIAEISAACCFSSQSNFTRAFRRATGATPLTYRQSYQG
jgi:AraC family transcriptional regulator